MNNDQLLLSIGLVTLLLLLLLGFLLFMLLWQRGKNNRFIMEKEVMASKFNEQLFKAQLEMQEQTFNLISMEIHDNVGQTLSLLKVQLNIIEQKEVFDKILISDIKNNVGKAMSDLRDIAKSLSSERVIQSTLPELTAYELKRLAETGTISVNQTIRGDERILRNEHKLILFRIIQECLQNITKHARAQNVTITIDYRDKHILFSINDNGKGFVDGAGQPGLGLKNIKSRAAVIGGEAAINSTPGLGTTITITVPHE